MNMLLRLRNNNFLWLAFLLIAAISLRLTAASTHFCVSKIRHLSEREIIDVALKEESKRGMMRNYGSRSLYEIDKNCCRVEKGDADWLTMLLFQNYYFVTVKYETNEETRSKFKYKKYVTMVSVSSCGAALENAGYPIN